jgi:cytochrome P450
MEKCVSNESARIEMQGKGFHDFKHESNVGSFHHDFSKYVKSFGDVYFWKKGGFHVVTKASLAKQALINPAISCDRSSFFISRMPNMDLSLIQNFFAVVSKMMVMRDGEDHKQRRGIASFGLNDKVIDEYAGRIDDIVDSLIKEVGDLNDFDFVRDISGRLPSIILADLFAIPEGDRDDFYKWSNIMTGFFGGGTGYENEQGKEVDTAALSLKKYFTKLLAIRKEAGSRDGIKNDFFSGMLKVAQQFNLNDEDLISQAIMMLVAGQVTTTDQMNNIMFQLLGDETLKEQLSQNPVLIPKMIEELKRLDPAVTFIFRVASSDTMIGEQPVLAGETVFISTHCINRDPELFSNPNDINILRKNNNHFSYGHGAHYCMGARLGRIEMNKLFTYLIKKYPHMKLGEGNVQRDHYSLSFSGFKTMPMVLE